MELFSKIVDAILSGQGSGGMIAIMLLIIVALGFVVFGLWKSNNEKTDKLLEQSDKHTDALAKANDDYREDVNKIMEDYRQDVTTMADAVNRFTVILAELKGKL